MEEELKSIEENYHREESRRNSRILWWAIGIFVFFVVIFCGVLGYLIVANQSGQLRISSSQNQSANSSAGTETSEIKPIDTSQDPIQQNLMEADMITLQGEKGEIFLSPMATYSVSAKIMSAKNYSDDWQAEFEPTDLALAWGDLVKSKYQEGITYTQSGRWYYYNYDSTFKSDGTYVTEHSSNHHIIPANDTIKKAVQKIKEGQKVKIDGYLVSVRYVMAKGEYTQVSSLSRSDTGDGACEIVYVKKLQVGDRLYQ